MPNPKVVELNSIIRLVRMNVRSNRRDLRVDVSAKGIGMLLHDPGSVWGSVLMKVCQLFSKVSLTSEISKKKKLEICSRRSPIIK